MPILETKDLGISFGGLQAVDNVYLTIEEKEIVGLIGPNGAGKTTVFNLLTGVYTPPRARFVSRAKASSAKSPTRSTASGLPGPFRISACSKT